MVHSGAFVPIQAEPEPREKVIIFCDGGSRGNPGPAALGFVIQDYKGSTIFEEGRFLGLSTNNLAEYAALSAGLAKALRLGFRRADCFLDSELVVKQLKGEYRVKDVKIKTLFAKILALTRKFDRVNFTHVERRKNSRADELVNRALDEKVNRAGLRSAGSGFS